MNKPTDDEIDVMVAAYLGDCGPQATRVYSFARAVLAKWGQPAHSGEPVYAFRRKGLDDFCTCTEKRYAELSDKPTLFETRIFYTAPQPVEREPQHGLRGHIRTGSSKAAQERHPMTNTTNTSAAISSCTDRQFTKKPVTIQAIQWTGRNLREVIAFTDGPPDTRSAHAGMAWDAYVDLVAMDGLKIYTLEGKMSAAVGDWIIKGVKGEMYPCKDEIFRLTYEPVVARES